MGGGGRGGQDTTGQSPYLGYSNRQDTQEPPTLHCAKQEMRGQVFWMPTSLCHHLPAEAARQCSVRERQKHPMSHLLCNYCCTISFREIGVIVTRGYFSH